MGCFHFCFGGDGDEDRRRRRRKSRRQSPGRFPPGPNHAPVVRATSVAADVVVREASPPLRGAKASKPPVAVDVLDEEVRAAAPADVVEGQASPPLLHRARASKQQSDVEVTGDAVGAASDSALKEASLRSDEAKAPTAPHSVAVVKDVVTSSSPAKDLRETREQEAPSLSSLLPENKATLPCLAVKCSTLGDSSECYPAVISVVSTSGSELRESSEQDAPCVSSLPPEKEAKPPVSPLNCSPPVVAPVCTHDALECSPVVTAVVSSSGSELSKPSEHGSRSSGKKKVTFNMNVTIYENAAEPEQEEGYAVDEGKNNAEKVAALPENHRYRNCSESEDDAGEEYSEDDAYGDDSDEEEDFLDCKIDLLDEEEMSTDENKQESHESLFSLSISNDQQNDDEITSSAPKSGDTSVEKESPLIKGNNLHCRSKFVRPVLNPVQNLSEWKELKSLKAGPASSKKFDKENVQIMPNVDANSISNSANQEKVGASNSSKKEVSVDASLSTWLASSDNLTVDKVQSKSPSSISSVSQDERSGAQTIDNMKTSSVASTPRSASYNREVAPALGTVGSYWSCMRQENDHSSSRSDSGNHGIPNTTSKYREDRRVNWHSTPFNVRLDRALKKTA